MIMKTLRTLSYSQHNELEVLTKEMVSYEYHTVAHSVKIIKFGKKLQLFKVKIPYFLQLISKVFVTKSRIFQLLVLQIKFCSYELEKFPKYVISIKSMKCNDQGNFFQDNIETLSNFVREFGIKLYCNITLSEIHEGFITSL